jgi:prepilin-type N-terminal cleavage/methylation domain-containing protein
VSKRAQAFTLIELLVVMAAVSVLAMLTMPALARSRLLARRAACLNNLRQIGIALQTYYNTHETYPPGDLPQALSPHLLGGSPVFRCPVDPGSGPDSYADFYCPRWERTAVTGQYTLSCPRHAMAGAQSAPVLYSVGEATIEPLRDVRWNGQPILPGNTATGGVLAFACGTRAFGLFSTNLLLATSFDRGRGKCYSVIAVPENEAGTVICAVEEGSKLEVVTPRAVITAEKKATFWATTWEEDGTQTRVTVLTGAVTFSRRNGRVETVTAGQQART